MFNDIPDLTLEFISSISSYIVFLKPHLNAQIDDCEGTEPLEGLGEVVSSLSFIVNYVLKVHAITRR